MKSAMKIAVLGTGPVGQTIATKIGDLGHAVFVGTRDPAATLARDKPTPAAIDNKSSWLTPLAGCCFSARSMISRTSSSA